MSRLPDPRLSRAYLFGSAAYLHDELPDLPAVAHNLRDLGAVLTAPSGGFAAEHCTVHLDPPGTVDVFGELRRCAEEAEDTLLVYFAGHGMVRKAGELYLGLPAARRSTLAVTGFPYSLLREVLAESPALNKVVVLDCCFSGWAVQGMGGGDGEALASPEELEIEGSYVLTATPATSTALAPEGAEHTSFTGELLYVLRSGVPGAGELLPLDAVARAVRQRARLRGLPMPDVRAGGSAGRLALLRNAAAAPPAAAAGRAAGRRQARAGRTGVQEPPPLPRTPPAAGVARPLALAGTLHTTKRELAETLRAHGPDAARRFFGDGRSAATPSEGWADLLGWLRQFGNPDTDDVEGRIALVDRHLADRKLSPALKLLCLLRWLDPAGPVVHRGRRITYGLLARACLAGGGADAADRRLRAELADTPLLDVLAGFGELAALRGIRAAWSRSLDTWHAAVARQHGWPEAVRRWADETAPGVLLAALLPAPQVAEAVRRLPPATPPEDPPPWYAGVLRCAGGPDTLLARMAEAELAPAAREEVRARLLAREESERRLEEAGRRERERQEAAARAEAEHRERHRAWLDAERARLHPRARVAAAFRALAVTASWTVPPLAVVWLTWWFSSYEFDTAVSLSQLAGLASLGAALYLVRRAWALGALYRPGLRSPSAWLPPRVPALALGGVLPAFRWLAGDSSSRSDEMKADSDLLRADAGKFFDFVGQNSYDTGEALWAALLFVPAAVGCLAIGLHAGRILTGRLPAGGPPPPVRD
ncbi:MULTISPECIES: caspase, EACC1-associated type [Streptomyces]|uniref:caspase, EACC1-associated type n=1 Tax=Streptomyces TaxID=1883 RepID=UPI0016731D25|nr:MULTISPECIES: caspase family protein [Streptomyces]MBD3579537.1 caspase family protein [Streptomyces sp. KD18]GGT23359.1 hypothetical protein GCM10010286_56050 [Streptomyces toxytricini]